MNPTEIRNLAYRYANEFAQHFDDTQKVLEFNDYTVLVDLFVEALHEINNSQKEK